MPLWFADPAHGTFKNDARLTEQQIDTIVKWVDAGAPRGIASDEPTPQALTRRVAARRTRLRDHAADDRDPRGRQGHLPNAQHHDQHSEDRWIRALEIRPSNREVTHHFGVVPRRRQRGAVGIHRCARRLGRRHASDGVPRGCRPLDSQGQQLGQIPHYHPNGKAQTDQTRVGLYFGRGDLNNEVASAAAGDICVSAFPRARRTTRCGRLPALIRSSSAS